MSLKSAIEIVALATVRLQEALAAGDITRAAAGVQERADALAALRASHAAAAPGERVDCAASLRDLEEQDAQLQRAAAERLQKVDLQRSVQAEAGRQPARGPDFRNGCLDRTA